MSFITENYSEETGKKYERKFFSKTFDPRNREELEKEYIEFLKEDVQTKEGLERFTEKWSELAAIVDEAGSLSYVGMTSDTKNEKAEKDYLHLVENIFPLCQVYEDRVKEKFLSSPALNQLNSEYYALFIKQVRSEKEIYREENISLHTKDSLLAQNYQKITGAWMAEFEGKRRTMQEINVFLESPDRDLRERAYRTRVGVHLQDAENLENLFDEMLNTRAKIASNAGFSNYRDYKFVAGGRFDYTPSDCLRFHDAIAETISPLLSEWTKEKCSKLGISSLRPWDISVDPDAKEQIRAFGGEEEFLEKTGKIFDSIHPRLGSYFQFMRKEKLLDLSSREGKAPGGYMTELTERRVPFIFMNAVGTKRDVETLLHEAGHSFHAFLCREQILKGYRSSPLEFAEVASMSMELLGRKHFDFIYRKEDIQRVKKEQLVKIVEFFPFMSMIDSFQHWVYTAKENGRKERGDKWQELNKKFQPFLDMSGLAEIERTRWQYPHIYTSPFYYIEYGIAQVGALQIWKNSLENSDRSILQYMNGLSKGGSLSLPELFASAGIRFAMDKKTLSELLELIKKELEF